MKSLPPLFPEPSRVDRLFGSRPIRPHRRHDDGPAVPPGTSATRADALVVAAKVAAFYGRPDVHSRSIDTIENALHVAFDRGRVSAARMSWLSVASAVLCACSLAIVLAVMVIGLATMK